MKHALLLLLVLPTLLAGQGEQPGYDDTPKLQLLSGLELPWRVHDRARLRPVKVAAECLVTPAPKDALRLFDGSSADHWRTADGKGSWKVQDGLLIAGGGDVHTTMEFSDIQLHLEWRAPMEADRQGQARGNSGVFLMDRYEVQILESEGSVTYADGQAAALYGQWPPLVNATAPMGSWNSYDITFRAPRFGKTGALDAPARVTVVHNGLIVQNNREFLGATAHRTRPRYEPHGTAALRLQDHGNPVAFRNIWLRSLSDELDTIPR
jgi:hypothetical protein